MVLGGASYFHAGFAGCLGFASWDDGGWLVDSCWVLYLNLSQVLCADGVGFGTDAFAR